MNKDKALQIGEYASWAVIVICGLVGVMEIFAREITNWRIAGPNIVVFLIAAVVHMKIVNVRHC